LAAQLLPPPLGAIDPAERLGIDLASVRTAEDCRKVLATVLTAVGRGQIAPAEGACIGRRVDERLRAGLRLSKKFAASGRREDPRTARPTHPG
ncbi:MAG TPA: hypothetical protein VE687_06365, partial [Stellaceae bacterium]|nr:hypothetical protein [Stellaceae bacterium]